MVFVYKFYRRCWFFWCLFYQFTSCKSSLKTINNEVDLWWETVYLCLNHLNVRLKKLQSHSPPCAPPPPLISLSAVMEPAGVGLTSWLTWSSIGWLKVTISGFSFTALCFGSRVSMATLKPLVSTGVLEKCIRGPGGWGVWERERKRGNERAS